MKTWESLPSSSRPLKNRTNIVITRSPKSHKQPRSTPNFSVQFMNFQNVRKHILRNSTSQFFIIGGSDIYELFMNDPLVQPQDLYITHHISAVERQSAIKFHPSMIVTMKSFPEMYSMISYSSLYKENDVSFRFLKYRWTDHRSPEQAYLDLAKDVLLYGKHRDDRTGTGTISLFGKQMHFDISDNKLPLLTTKQVPWKSCIKELLWFMRGDTDSKILQKQGVRIWDGNTSRSFLDARGLHHYPEGVLGPGYGWQWRFFGAKYDVKYANTSVLTSSQLSDIGGFDQIQYILDELKHNPFSRRIFLSAWNPAFSNEMSLVPCHVSCQFYVEVIDDKKHISCHMYQRSADIFLGEPWNILSYSILTHILAKKSNMLPHKLVISIGDAHIYNDHLDVIQAQLQRSPRPSPVLHVSEDVATKNISDITVDDFSVIGYFPHPKLAAKMSV